MHCFNLFVIEAKQVDEEVYDEGVVELEQEAVLEDLAHLFWVLLFELMIC